MEGREEEQTMEGKKRESRQERQKCEGCTKSILKYNMKKHRSICKGVPWVKKSRADINHDAYERNKAALVYKKRKKTADIVFERLKGIKYAE